MENGADVPYLSYFQVIETRCAGANKGCERLEFPIVMENKSDTAHSCSSPGRLGCRACLLLCFLACFIGCKQGTAIVAVIPRTCGTALWESEHAGTASALYSRGMDIYWNAPMRDDDVQMQIALVEQSLKRRYAGIIVAPIETLPMRTPIRRVMMQGTPVVVVGTDLGIPPGPGLSYVMSDEEMAGQMAARRLGAILNGIGNVAIVGIRPQLTSCLERERSLEATLAREFPGIHVVLRRFGLASAPQEQLAAEEILSGNEKIDAFAALTLVSTRGVYYALGATGREKSVKLVGFDQDLLPPLRTGGIDSVVAQNTYAIGRIAVEQLDREMHGAPTAGVTRIPPVLMTRENLDSPEIRGILHMVWWRSP